MLAATAVNILQKLKHWQKRKIFGRPRKKKKKKEKSLSHKLTAVLKKIPNFTLWRLLQNPSHFWKHSKLVYPNTYSPYSYISISPNKEWWREEENTSFNEIKGQRKRKRRDKDKTRQYSRSACVFCSGFSLSTIAHAESLFPAAVIKRRSGRISNPMLFLVTVGGRHWLTVWTIYSLSNRESWLFSMLDYHISVSISSLDCCPKVKEHPPCNLIPDPLGD